MHGYNSRGSAQVESRFRGSNSHDFHTLLLHCIINQVFVKFQFIGAIMKYQRYKKNNLWNL